MRLFAYAFKAGKWVETPRLSVRDVALLVDTENRTIYIWHGPKSKIKDQNEAKKLLLSLRDRYASFQFQKVGRNPAPELQQEIKRLLGSPLGQGKVRIFAIAGMVAGLVGVGLAVMIIMTLYGVGSDIVNAETGYESFLAFLFPAETNAWNAWLQTLTWLTGFGMIAFGLAALFSLLSKRYYMFISLLIGLGVGLITILYVNVWRPSNADFAGQGVFEIFQFLLLVLELVAFVPFTLGFVVEIVRIAQE